MQMDAGLDTGPMLLTRATPIGVEETSGALSTRLSVLGAAAMLECIEQLALGRAAPRPQPAQGATYAAKIDKAEGLIDWRRDAASIARQVRAFNPRPVAETRFAGEPLKVLSARAEADPAPERTDTGDSPRVCGRILGLEGDGMRVRCAQGTLLVGQVQRAGRRPVLAREFVASCDAIGKQLG
jgi:methionyl-tRNA formyltransferase